MSAVVAVVVTYNRKLLLMDCLEALARQTAPVARVVLVDNASTDGTEELVAGSGIAERLPIDYLRLRRNGGGAEGFHYGVREALASASDWLWLMDDDCEPRDGCLERLLAAPPAADPSTAVLAPVVLEPGGALLPINRGHVRPRWFFSSLVPATAAEHAAAAAPIGFCSFVGPLVHTSAARRIGLPLREMFIRFEDVEYLDRLGPDDRMWLVGDAAIVHKDPQPVAGGGLRPRWREYRRPAAFADGWKLVYGVRNQIYAGRRGGWLSGPRALSQVLVQAVRTLAFGDRRARMLRLLAVYALDGWRGRFRNVPPSRWPAMDEALRYDVDPTTPVRHLRGAPSPPSRRA